jgi:hypothetical protein
MRRQSPAPRLRLSAVYAANYPNVAKNHAADIDQLINGARRVYGRTSEVFWARASITLSERSGA